MGSSNNTDQFLAQGDVLREVSHDLGNRFHRFYYLAHLLRESLPDGSEPVSEGVASLEGAVTEIEGLVRRTMTWLAPMELHLVKIGLSDLVTSLRGRIGSRSLELLEPSSDSHPGLAVGVIEVAVDPARIGELFAIIQEWLGAADDGSSVEFPLRARLLADGDGASAPTSAGLALQLREMPARKHREGLGAALAQKILVAHGGRLCFETDAETGDAWLQMWFGCEPSGTKGSTL